MPCGVIVFDYHLLVVIVIILVELVVSRPILIDKDQRELSMSNEKLTKKDRRHSIFDDKNRAVLGELVSRFFSFFEHFNRNILSILYSIHI